MKHVFYDVNYRLFLVIFRLWWIKWPLVRFPKRFWEAEWSLTASKLQKLTVNEPNRRNKLETALKSIVTKRWWFFGVQQNVEFGRFDKNHRNLLESCSIKIKIVFLSNDRAEFKFSYDAKIINLQSGKSGKYSQIRGNVKMICLWLKLSAVLIRQ